MKWYRYDGNRIPSPGLRTFVESPATLRFAEPVRRYGYVWETAEMFYGSVDLLRSGEVEDLRLGPCASEGEARKLVEQVLHNGGGRPGAGGIQ